MGFIYFLKKIDWKLILPVLVLSFSGLFSLLSSNQELFFKQLIWFGLGVVVVFLLSFLDLRSFFSHKSFVFTIYGVANALLILTYFLAPQIKGNRAWILIGSFQFQPAEIAKVALIIVLAYFFSKKHIGIGRWRIIISSFIYSIIPAFLIFLQPDLGSALILIAIWLGFVLVSGMPAKKLITTLVVFVLFFVLMWSYALKDYQKERITGLFFPEKDPLGSSYNVIQSKIAIGSGGLWGKGFKQGTQVQLGFLPESENDFIFAAIAEEGGLLATSIVCLAFLYLILRVLKIGAMLSGNFYSFVCLGASILWIFQFLVNVGSNLGILPVVGITLPFVSYGGSSLISNMILIGMIHSFYLRK